MRAVGGETDALAAACRAAVGALCRPRDICTCTCAGAINAIMPCIRGYAACWGHLRLPPRRARPALSPHTSQLEMLAVLEHFDPVKGCVNVLFVEGIKITCALQLGDGGDRSVSCFAAGGGELM